MKTVADCRYEKNVKDGKLAHQVDKWKKRTYHMRKHYLSRIEEEKKRCILAIEQDCFSFVAPSLKRIDVLKEKLDNLKNK